MPNQHTKKAAQKSARAAKRSARKVPSRDEIIAKQGHKDDGQKARYDLIPAGPLHMLACLYTLGGIKYEDENWRKGINYRRLFAALMRHAWAWMRGIDIDAETGLPNMVAVAWCAFGIIELQHLHKRPDLDDRFRTELDLTLADYESALQLMIEKKAGENQKKKGK